MTFNLNRRELLTQCLAFSSLAMTSGLLLPVELAALEEDTNSGKPTAWNEMGPFYKRDAPRITQLRASGDAGFPLAVSGRVLDTRGSVVQAAVLEIWHADHLGRYDIDGYRYRTTLVSAASGNYAFESVVPGHYPDRVCQHIHYFVNAPGHKPLTTQLYFASDPVFEGDPDRNYSRDPLIQNRDLVRPVVITGDPKASRAAVTFEIVLERL